MSRVLIAEDEPRIASFVEKGLKANGFTVTVVGDGLTARDAARSGEHDLMVLDIGLPVLDGFAVLKALRAERCTIPVIVLRARGSVTDTVAGLEGGADDYMPKPFRFEELLARVRLRPATRGQDAELTVLTVGDLSLDLRTRRAHVAGRTSISRPGSSRSPRPSCATPARCSPASSCSPTSGAATSTPVPTSSTSTSGTCARSSARTGSRRFAGWATASPADRRPPRPTARRLGWGGWCPGQSSGVVSGESGVSTSSGASAGVVSGVAVSWRRERAARRSPADPADGR